MATRGVYAMARTGPTPEQAVVSHADAEPSENLERRTRPLGGSVRTTRKETEMEELKAILKQFDQHDDSNADYIREHWNEAVEVYDNDGSMLDFDNIVRLEQICDRPIEYQTYKKINRTVGDLEEWLETALQIREILTDPLMPSDEWENAVIIS